METSNKIRKLIDLPVKTAAGIMVLAAKKGQNTKNYIESLLVAHELKASSRKTKESN